VTATKDDSEKAGVDYFLAGIRLVKENKLDEAAMNFWGSIVSYPGGNDEPLYKVDEAMRNFLLCYQKQNKLALGYAFVAAQMFQAKDGRGREFLQKAYAEDPTDANILQLVTHMGETTESILSNRVYSPEESSDAGDDALSQKTTKAHACRTKADCRTFINEAPNLDPLEPGWEDIVQRDHIHTQSRLINTPPINITIPPLPQFEVYYDAFWKQHFYGKDKTAELSWEPYTFTVLHKYITMDTIMVDLGAWYGPTTLFGGQLAKRVFSLEPDPVAYTTLDMNVQLNQAANADDTTDGFPSNIHVHPIAVVAPRDAGYVTLETGQKGNSESMITTTTTKEETFEAAGYTLPFLFNLWGIHFEEQPVFIKIDIEAYECSLIPSFYEWLSAESSIQALTMFVSFHPQLRLCTMNQMKGVLKTLTLFTTIECNQQTLPKITEETTFSEFESMLDTAGCLTNKETADFVLIA
jgi:FkbM family methyltransferase